MTKYIHMSLRPNVYDYLKILALLSMIIDHMGYFLFPEEIWFRVFWRIAFPLFLLLVGYNGSYKRRYSLWIVGIIVQIAIWWFWYRWLPVDPMLNILLVIAGTRVLLRSITKHTFRVQILFFAWALVLFPRTFSWIDYGTLALAFWLGWWWIRTWKWPWVLWAWSILVGVHMLYMILYRGFPEYTWLMLCLLWVLLILFGVLLHQGNTPYLFSSWVNTIVVWISANALRIYVAHGAVFAVLQFFLL